MNKKIIYTIIFSFLLIFVFAGKGKAQTLEKIANQITTIQNQINNLQNQLLQLTSSAWWHNFEVNLKYGDTGPEVEALQIALEKEGFVINEQEKNDKEFGGSTAAAVVQFQESYKDDILTPQGLLSGTGYVGELTRKKLNELYGRAPTPESEYKCPDINDDGKVDILDIFFVSDKLNAWKGDARYDAKADVNGDDLINNVDLNYVSKYNGKKTTEISQCPTTPIVPPIPVFDFSFSLNPDSGKIVQGNSTPIIVSVSLVPGVTTQNVSLSAFSSEPTLTFNWIGNSCTPNPNCSRNLIITTSSTTPAGTYAITVTGTGGKITETATFTLTVPPPSCTVEFDKDAYTLGETMTITYSYAPEGTTLLLRNPSGGASNWIISGSGSQTYALSYSAPTGIWDITLLKLPCYANNKVTVNPPSVFPFDFSISLNPNSGTVSQGDPISIKVTATLTSGPTQLVTFTPSAPVNSSIKFVWFDNNFSNSCTPTPNCSQTLYIVPSPDTPAGTYTITITGTGGGETDTADFTLTVLPPACTVAFDKDVYTLGDTMTINYTNAPAGSSLAVRDPAVGNKASWTVTGNGSQAYALKTTDPTGTWDTVLVKITGCITNNTDTATVTAAPVIPIFDFDLSLNPSSAKIYQGDYVSAILTAKLVSEPTQEVKFSILPHNTSITSVLFGNSSIPPCSQNLIISTSSTTPAGTYTITITGTGGGETDTADFTLTVLPPACTVAFDKDVYTLGDTMTINYTNAPAGSSLAVRDPAVGNKASWTVTGNGSQAYTLKTTDPTGTWDTVLVKVASSCNITDKATVNAAPVIPIFKFDLSVNQTPLQVTQGNSVSTSLNTFLLSEPTQSVTFSASGLPTGAPASFNPPSCSPPCSSTISISTSSTTPAGTYTITVTGTGGGETDTATLTLTVKLYQPLVFNLSFSPNPVKTDQNVIFIVQANPMTPWPEGYGTTHAFCVTKSETCKSYDDCTAQNEYYLFCHNPTAQEKQTGIMTEIITPQQREAHGINSPGNYTLYAGCSRNDLPTSGGDRDWRDAGEITSGTLQILPSIFDFDLSVNQTPLQVTQGNSVSTSLNTFLLSEPTQSVTFSASGLPTGAPASFNPPSCSPPCSSTISISTSSTTPAGTYTITVTGTGGGETDTADFNLTVLPPPCTVSFDKDAYTLGETMTINYTNAPAGSSLAVRDPAVGNKASWTVTGNGSQAYALKTTDPTGTWNTVLVKITGCITNNTDTATVTAAPVIPPAYYTLTVSKAGTGTVTSSPAGINCGSTCSSSFSSGASITLAAAPQAGSVFAGWSGGGCSGTGNCTVTMTAAKTVTATFNVIPVGRTTWIESCGTATKSGCTCSNTTEWFCAGTPKCSYTCPARTHTTASSNCNYIITNPSGTGSGICDNTNGTGECSAPANCLAGFACFPNGSNPGACTYTCVSGWKDVNNNSADGCETAITASRVEPLKGMESMLASIANVISQLLKMLKGY
jgi:hypothetical protein